MAYTTIDDPTIHFNTKLYTGNGSTNAITGVGFQPDWTLLKDRNDTSGTRAYDSVRGAIKRIRTDLTDAEIDDSDGLTAFGSDGFTLGADGATNANTTLYVSWNWKAGTSFSNDASATSIGTIDSTGSINTTAGFSIISYTGNGTLGATVAHGLGVAPSMVLVKRRDTTGNWWTYHSSLGGANKYIVLNSTSAAGTSTNIWNNTAPTSTVFSLGDNSNYPEVNGTSNTFIAYCFAEKKGYSKFGSYTGNGNADGTFVYTGFRPAWVVVKKTNGTDHWFLIDNKRLGYNEDNYGLYLNLTNVEYSGSIYDLDILSNGFKARDTDGMFNGSGDSYIYMAFAESPFTNSSGVPTNAR